MHDQYGPLEAVMPNDRASSVDVLSSDCGSLQSPRPRIVVAGLGAWVLTVFAVVLGQIPLPFDEHFAAVLYLMWSGNQNDQLIVKVLFQIILALCAIDVAILLCAAALWRRPWNDSLPIFLVWAYRYALALPLFALISMNLGRVVANLLYAVAPLARSDLSPYLSQLEATAILHLQKLFFSGQMSAAAAFVYSVVWTVLLIGFGPLLVLLDRRQCVNEALVGSVLLSVLAVPLFLVLPVFDPWSMNPLYGYQGPGPVGVKYLYPDAQTAQLRDIATRLRWATGACLPSLHVAFPFLFALIARRHRMVMLWRVYLFCTMLTAFVIVYLGRHWIIDIPASIPFCLAVFWCTKQVTLKVTLEPRRLPTVPSVTSGLNR